MAVISRKHGYLFIESPRTGSTAVARGVLIAQLDGEAIPPENLRDENGKVTLSAKHASLQDLVDHGLLTEDEATNLFKFTAVRNPFDSIVSDYLKRAGDLHDRVDNPNAWIHRDPSTREDMEFARNHSFPEWVERRFTKPGNKRSKGVRRPVKPRHVTAKQLLGMDEVIRFESLQEGFDEVLAKVGISGRHEIPVMHATAARDDRHYSEYYDDRSREIISTVFAPDLERFGYTF